MLTVDDIVERLRFQCSVQFKQINNRERETMSPEQIIAELKNCKTVDRYLTDRLGYKYWVFGLPTGALLVRLVVGMGILKPVRTMEYSEVESIEVA